MSAKAHISARPRSVEFKEGETPPPTGLQSLGLDPQRDSYLFVPKGHQATRPAPLMVMLHGAGGHAHHGLHPLVDLAEAGDLILLAPASRNSTWDVIMGGYGPDVELLNQALELVFNRYSIDSSRIAIGGFSDGASYALSLGITNGDLFTHIVAFSPGFVAPAAQRDKPQIFVSHGVDDNVLPIQQCSRRIVPQLQRAGYEVIYREFDGGHAIPPDIARDALAWFTAHAHAGR